MGEGRGSDGPRRAADVLAAVLGAIPVAASQAAQPGGQPAPPGTGETSCFDFDLAEFPLFRFSKDPAARLSSRPLAYADVIRGRDGRPVERSWSVYPGRLGYGGPTAHVLLFDLLQLYAEQGAEGSQIQFGTLRSLFLRRGERNPSKRDYERMRRDFAVLRGYEFVCKNAFWDARRRAYADMEWRLFGEVFYFKAGPGPGADEMPFGFIEVSPTFLTAARSRGFFDLGFSPQLFYRLRPLSQRLAVYLAKVFTSQAVHRRAVEDLARLLPVEAKNPSDARKVLRRAADDLLEKGTPTLAGYALEQGPAGRWLASFRRGDAPRWPWRLPRAAAEGLTEADRAQVERIVAAVGGDADRPWWAQYVRRLGAGAVDRALGQLKEKRRLAAVHNPGGLLTKIFKDIAREAGVALQ
jgi:hypothetical protein